MLCLLDEGGRGSHFGGDVEEPGDANVGAEPEFGGLEGELGLVFLLDVGFFVFLDYF